MLDFHREILLAGRSKLHRTRPETNVAESASA